MFVAFLKNAIFQHFVDKPKYFCYNNIATQLHKFISFVEKHFGKSAFSFFPFHKWKCNCVATLRKMHFSGASSSMHLFLYFDRNSTNRLAIHLFVD